MHFISFSLNDPAACRFYDAKYKLEASPVEIWTTRYFQFSQALQGWAQKLEIHVRNGLAGGNNQHTQKYYIQLQS